VECLYPFYDNESELAKLRLDDYYMSNELDMNRDEVNALAEALGEFHGEFLYQPPDALGHAGFRATPDCVVIGNFALSIFGK